MGFSLYYVTATYHKEHQSSSGVIGFGSVCKTIEIAREERNRFEQNEKVASVVITNKRFGT
jgi:hypothetical protein